MPHLEAGLWRISFPTAFIAFFFVFLFFALICRGGGRRSVRFSVFFVASSHGALGECERGNRLLSPFVLSRDLSAYFLRVCSPRGLSGAGLDGARLRRRCWCRVISTFAGSEESERRVLRVVLVTQ